MSDGPTTSLPSLSQCEWLTRKETQRVFSAIEAGGGEARAVGGAVRNSLLGRPVLDIDLATNLTPQAVLQAAASAGLKAVPTGIDHGTVTVISGDFPYEVTTLREDVDTFGRHAEVAFSTDWTADAKRRDFTINSLYADCQGDLFDPLGGYGDLAARRVQFIGDPRQRIREDYLRILRFFRFTADYGEGAVDVDGLWACLRERAGLSVLSAERVHTEFAKLLISARAAEIIGVMFEHGLLLDITGLVPDLTRMNRLVDLEDGLQLSPDAYRRLAALSIRMTEDADLLAKRFRLSRAVHKRLVNMSRTSAFVGTDMSEKDARAALYDLGEEAYTDQLLLAWAEGGGDEKHLGDLVRLPERWTAPHFPLSGHDAQAAGIEEGRAIGDALRSVERWWVLEDFPSDIDQLKDKLKEWAISCAS